MWESFLDHCIPEEEERLLLQVFMGLAISTVPNCYYEQYLWLYGLSGTGKSLVLKIISDLVGKDSVGYLTGDEINTQSTFTLDLTGKKLCSVDEFKLHNKAKEKGWIYTSNQIVSSDSHKVNLKYSQPFIAENVYSTLIISSNDNPPVSDTESGVARRIRSIQFVHRPETLDYDLRKKLNDELNGIAQWALEGLRHCNDPVSYTHLTLPTKRIV